jgi:hypothetical protein
LQLEQPNRENVDCRADGDRQAHDEGMPLLTV